jgi:hypothetical protein
MQHTGGTDPGPPITSRVVTVTPSPSVKVTNLVECTRGSPVHINQPTQRLVRPAVAATARMAR